MHSPLNIKATVYWFILGVVLGIGHMFYAFLFVILMYILVRRMSRDAPFELVIPASVFNAILLFQGLQIALHPDLYRWYRILEPAAAGGVASLLAVFRTPILAWCLILYSSALAVFLLCFAFLQIPRSARPEFVFADAMINGIVVWLLVSWVRRKSLPET